MNEIPRLKRPCNAHRNQIICVSGPSHVQQGGLGFVQVHVTLGHSTVMAEAQYFGLPDSSSQSPAAALASTISRIGQLALNVSLWQTGLCSALI